MEKNDKFSKLAEEILEMALGSSEKPSTKKIVSPKFNEV